MYRNLWNSSLASKFKLTRFTVCDSILPLHYTLLLDLLSSIHKLEKNWLTIIGAAHRIKIEWILVDGVTKRMQNYFA